MNKEKEVKTTKYVISYEELSKALGIGKITNTICLFDRDKEGDYLLQIYTEEEIQ